MKYRYFWATFVGSLSLTVFALLHPVQIRTPNRTPQVAGASTISMAHILDEGLLTAAINNERFQNTSEAVREDSRLRQLAQTRFNDMVENHYYAHENATGETFVSLLDNVSLSENLFACENLLLADTADVTTAIQQWIDSPSHKKCMLQADMTRIGVAHGVFDAETGQHLFVTVFAALNE